MESHYHAVVWIDHRRARVFHFNASEAEKLVVSPERPVRDLHRRSDSDHDHAPEDQSFLEDVAKSVADAGAILIVGPAGEKNELVKHIKRVHPAMTIRIEGVEAADHPTDGELVNYARAYLKAADLMRS